MGKEDAPRRQLSLDPVYKSSLVYRPSDYYDNVAPKHNYYDEYYEDVEAQKKEEQKAILTDAASAKKAKRRRTCSLCCCSTFYIIFILLLAAAIVVIKLIPKDPAVSVGDVKITEFVYNQTGSQQPQLVEKLRADLSCGLNVTNRNPHASAIYTEINLALLYKNDSLGSFKIGAPGPQFEQRRKAMTSISADLPSTTTTIEAANAKVLESDVTNLNVQVDLTGSVKGQMKVLGMKVKKFDVSVDCKLNVTPGDGSSRKATQLSLVCYYDN